MKKKLVSNLRSKKLHILFITSLLVVALFAILNGGNFANNKNTHFISYPGYYNSNQYQIGSISRPSDTKIISMTDAANSSIPEGYTVTISTAEELNLFSKTLNQNESFRSGKYKLTTNIDYDINASFEPVQSFSGIFDGMGYEISNLKIDTAYDSYVTMFAKNEENGVISNFGLVNTNINIKSNEDESVVYHVAPVCGNNKGVIKYVFVRDLRNPQTQVDAGMVVNGHHLIAGLVYENVDTGSLTDSYVAYDILVNRETVDIVTNFSEMVANNVATIANLYFYHKSIEKYQRLDNGKIEIKYDSGTINQEVTLDNHIGEYCSSLNSLIENVSKSHDSNNNWYSASSYGDFATYLSGIVTPISRGVSFDMDTKTFFISNENDYSYMYELMNLDPHFSSSNVTYQITNNINLALIPSENYHYDRVIDAKITGAKLTDDNSLCVDEAGRKINYPTIYDGTVDKVLTEGIDTYGLFSYVSGEISNLNIVDVKLNITASSNIQSIGLAVGYLDGGIINNVNTFGEISFSSNIGKFYVGHVVGISGGSATISNVTSSGSITNEQTVSSGSNINGFMQGSAIGGIIGYSESTLTSLDTLLSTIAITAKTFTNKESDIAVGGILGAGYTNISKNLENRGEIKVTGNSKNLYVAGIIARHLGMKEQSSHFNNAGDITVTLTNQDLTYVAGITNVDIQTVSTDYLSTSQLKSNGRYQYYGTAFTNGAEVILDKNGNNNLNTEYTNVLNINSKNGFESKISGVYNLQYYNLNSRKTLGTQQIDINEFPEFAPVINVNSSATSDQPQNVEATTIYNLRDIEFRTSGNITSDLKYTGCILGEFIDYIDVRNEGDMIFNLNNQTNTRHSMYVSGIFDKLNNGHIAKNIYNGGNITITENSSNTVNLNVYASGICNGNESVISDSKYNPLNEDFDNKTIGSINNAINNGDIKITSNHLKSDTAIGSSQTCRLQGSVYVSGIVYENKGIISNTFNLGDLYTSLYLSTSSGIYIGGLVNTNVGENAQIRDSANNGTIHAINLCSATSSYVYAGGIVCENVSDAGNINQNISFTINYGEIFTFNAKANSTNPNEQIIYTRAGGILATGICNIVNTVNYGNVYSTETAGGMIGTIDLSLYDNNSNVIIANTLNYGTVKSINRYLTVQGSPVYAKYSDIRDINSSSIYIDYGFTAEPFYQYCGALIGIINYNNKDIINIRYLINFFENVQIVCREYNYPANISTDVTLLVNVSPNNRFIGQNVTYAPLSTVSDEYGNIGVFSEEFMFRRAMNGENINPNEVTDSYIGDFFQFVAFEKVNTVLLDLIGWREIAYLDAAERFARDLDALSNLITKAGIIETDTIVQEALSTNVWLESCDTLMLDVLLESALESEELTSIELDTLIKYILFESDTRIEFNKEARQKIVDKFIEYIEEKENQVDYLKVLNALLYDELLAKVIANDSLEYAEVYNLIRNCIESSDNLEEILNSYIELLKNDKTILEPLFSENYSEYYLEAKIDLLNTLLTGISDEQLKTILELLNDNDNEDDSLKYIMYLEQNPDIARDVYINIITNNTFDNINYMQAMNNAFAKYNISNIVTNEFDEQMMNNFNNVLDDYAENPENIYGNDFDNENITSLDIMPSIDYVDLWNLIKNDKDLQAYLSTNVLQNVVSVDGETGLGIYAKATEYTNTYQSNDDPSIEGNRQGKLRAEYAGTTITTRFIYTPDRVVSQATYFYGPYNSSYQIWWPNNDPGTYNKGFNLYTTGETVTGDATVRYVPFFCSVDQEFAQKMINGSSNPTLYEFYWNNAAANNEQQGGQSASQWVSTHIIDKRPDDGHHYLIKNYNENDYIDHYYDFSPGNRTSTNEYRATNITVGNQDLNLITHQAFATGEHRYRDYYLKGYISASLITGIWYQQNIWASGNDLLGAFLTAKNDQFHLNHEGVHTTQYINYFLNDLLMLDGVLTKGFGNNAVSSDEVNIINALITRILNSNDGKEVVIKALSNKALTGFDNSNFEEANILLNTVQNSSFALSSVENMAYLTNEKLNTILYNEDITLKEYFDSLINSYEYNYKEEIIINSVNDIDNFRKVILSMYDFSKETINYDQYSIQKSKIYDYVYEYALYLLTQNPDMTDDEITSLLNQISDTDLTTINNLFLFDKTIQNQTFNNITFNGLWTYRDLVNNEYNKSVTASNNCSINLALDGQASYINITYTGSITVNGTTYNNNTNNPTTITIQVNQGTNNLQIRATNGTTIYDIFSYYNEQIELVETPNITYNSVESDFTITTTWQSNPASKNLSISEFKDISSDVDVSFNFSYERNRGTNTTIVLENGGNGSPINVNDNNSHSYSFKINDLNSPLNITLSTSRNNYDYQQSTLTISNIYFEYIQTIDGITYTSREYLGNQRNSIAIESDMARDIGVQYLTGNTQGNITKYENVTNINTLNADVNSYFRLYVYEDKILNNFFDNINGNASTTSVQTNFNSYYDNLEGYAKYLVDSAIKESDSLQTIIVEKDSFVLVKARNTTNNIIGRVTLYNISNNTSNTSSYYCYQLPAGTYNITTNNSTVEQVLIFDVNDRIYVNTTGNTNKIVFEDSGVNRILFEEDYSLMALFNINNVITTPLEGLTKFETFIKVYPYIRNDGEFSASELWEKDLIELIMTLFPTMKDDKGNYSIFANSTIFDQTTLKELVELVSVADYENVNSALYKLITYVGSDYYDDVIIDIADISRNISTELLEEIKDIATDKQYTKIKNYYISAYLGDDLLDNQANNTLTNSKVYEILNDYNSGKYQFITSDTTIDSDKFIELMNHLGFNLSTEGFGIYALSSSKGILNGEFIPDNVVLDNLDTYYELDGNTYILTDEESSNWRGGIDGDENNISNNESVNYAVLVEMKQLKKSIGTTIFKFDLVDEKGITHYSSESSIDLEEGIITYYVPTGYFNNTSNNLNVIVDTISISNLATLKINGEVISDSNKSIVLDGLDTEYIITVYAEDETVTQDYRIQFVEMNVDFTITYANATNGIVDGVATVPYKDGQVVIALSSETLPENLDLTPYIDILSNGVKVNRETAFNLSNAEGDHIINSNSDAVITMDILSTLPHGEYEISVNIFGTEHVLKLTKTPSEECNILEFEYEGKDIAETLMTNGEYTSYIEFGRAYNYIDLTDPASSNFYLNRLLVSENATCNITAIKEEYSGLLTYTITYEVIAENGNSREYTHNLKEKHPFKNYDDDNELTTNFNFASYYKDGLLVETLVYQSENSNTINVSFDRGVEPQYRVKYTLSNFYLLGNQVEFIIDDENAQGVTYVDSYAGITAVVSSACDAGVYTLVYQYRNTATWYDGEYTREWLFPEFIITKNYSKDSTLANITYIDGNSMLSSQSTVLSVEKTFRPSDNNLNAGEVDYHVYNALPDQEKEIFAAGTYINYEHDNGKNYADSIYKDYYMIGALSNANLSYYAPIFKIEEHAEIYQYTTRYKLDNYGEGLQGDIPDKDILSNHETCYIYVPYTTTGTDIIIFLVEVDDQNKWTNVYTVESNATGEAIATLTANKGSFAIDGVTYNVHESAGKPTENTSLYMDYIGTPLEDHFWYVSYVIFSENALHTNDNTYIKYFHLSLIDLTNNVYFDIKVNAPSDFALESIYVTFAAEGVIVDENIISKQLSANVVKSSVVDGIATYLLDNEIQILPTGYYYFYLDLPDGYKVTYQITNGKTNRNDANSGYEGAYLPPSSIVPQRISITFTIEKDSLTTGIWGVSTSEIYTRKAVEIKEN